MLAFRKILAEHNRYRDHPFNWNPTDQELVQLFGTGQEQPQGLSRSLSPGRIRNADLVLRALKLMLQTSHERRIANPGGWIWACVHGGARGTAPWIQAPASTARHHARRFEAQ